MSNRLRNEKGIALAVSIFAVVVIGALIAASFYVGMQESRVGRNTIRIQQALSAAEEGVAQRVANWNPLVTNRIAIGDSLGFSDTLSGSAGWYRGYVFRLDSMMYLVSAEGFDAANTSRQRVGMLARIRPVELSIDAALELQGALTMGGNASVNGTDQPPTGWKGCPATTDVLPGVRTPQASDVSTKGKASIDGSPLIEEDGSINDSTLTWFGDTYFDELSAIATVVLPPSYIGSVVKPEPTLSGSSCDLSDLLNWGEPQYSGKGTVTACQGHFPVVYAPGDLTVNGVRGQGLLIVKGDLNIQGGFEFAGPVLVKGTIKFAGNGNKIMGGVVAANVITTNDDNDMIGTADIFYSSCAIDNALAFGAVAWPLVQRAWVNMYDE